jgi:hypothetical protein
MMKDEEGEERQNDNDGVVLLKRGPGIHSETEQHPRAWPN